MAMAGLKQEVLVLLVIFYITSCTAVLRSLNVSELEVDQGTKYELSRNASQSPLKFFEVSRPLPVPKSGPCASLLLLTYSFGNTISSPPVTVSYTPPKNDTCNNGAWDKAILRWRVASKGRQFDRISAVWLNRVEIFRTSTAEPVKRGIYWEVEKDITRYSSLLKKPSRDLAVVLGNVIDKTYTGFFNVTMTVDFYTSNKARSTREQPADLILPISMSTSGGGGYWFQIQNDTDTRTVDIKHLPRNIYRAELEVCVSFHGNDEFWYTNPSNDYLISNNITDTPGNGPYREVLAYLDGTLVGEIVPFPVIFTGGMNPLMWRPVAAIGAFNLPSYTLELTPFAGRLVDGKPHRFSLRVTNALRVWFVDANLHLWLDHSKARTSGRLQSYMSNPAEITYEAHYKGLDGTLQFGSSRSLSYSGYVESSYGRLMAIAEYSYKFSNTMKFSQGGEVQVINQNVNSDSSFNLTNGKLGVGYRVTHAVYPLHLYTAQQDAPNKTVVQDVKLSHELQVESNSDGSFVRVDNKQEASGKIWIQGNIVVRGDGNLNQSYVYENAQGCYHREVKARNTTKLYDQVDESCVSSSLF